MTASHGAELFWKPRPREAAVSWTLAMLANWCLMLQPTLVLWTQKVAATRSVLLSQVVSRHRPCQKSVILRGRSFPVLSSDEAGSSDPGRGKEA